MKESLQAAMNLPPIDQVGFVVRDMDAALALYGPLFGPFDTMVPGPMTYNYRGVDQECELKLAFGKSGDLEIELIQWVSGGSPHKEFIDSGREGIHHLRFIVDDLESALERAQTFNYQAIWTASFAPGLAVAYLERADDPLIVELFENHPDEPYNP
ncbi:MAG: hypothetical protein HOC23_03390 [Halieaceae bacterium]|jgi:methylmalonyl-CoA/ethylmalonyl-CoA epimerase|nr:hypothetical protein [Halieaceae bacterium]